MSKFVSIKRRVPNITLDMISRASTAKAGEMTAISLPYVGGENVWARDIRIDGRTVSLGIMDNGTLETMPIKFDNGVGLYGTVEDTLAVGNGVDKIAEFRPDGAFVVKSITSNSGTIDFGGCTVTGIASVQQKPGAYSLAGDPVLVAEGATATILSIPLSFAAGVAQSVWSVDVRAAGISAAGGGVSHSFMVRAGCLAGATPTMVGPFKKHVSADFPGSAVGAALIGASIAITATSPVGSGGVRWQAAADVLRANN